MRVAYGDAGATVGSAYVALLRALLAPLGMPVLDASHPAVAAASAETLDAARTGAAQVEARLLARSREIEAAGYAPQVDQVPGLSLVFAREGTVKRRLTVAEAAIATDGTTDTPNVLLRPVVEQQVLPTVAYVAGPGELAYFAQVKPIADSLDLGAPLAVPRWSCTLVEPHVRQIMERLGTTEKELATPGALESRLAREALDPAATEAIARLRSALATLPQWLRTSAEALDLERAVQGASGAMLHRAERLERRLLAAVKRRETAMMSGVATVRAALRPRGERQERVLNPIPMLARNGLPLLDAMCDEARGHASTIINRKT